MKTIEERAKEYIDRLQINDIPSEILLKNGYINGAKKQQNIDIDKACDWIQELLVAVFGSDTERIDKEIFSFRRHMKGE